MEDQERIDRPEDDDVEAHRRTLREGEEPRAEGETDEDDVELHKRTVR